MKVKITAGTHIGITGCYGEKNLTIPGKNPDQEVEDIIRSEFAEEIAHGKGDRLITYKTGKRVCFALINGKHETAIEWYYTIRR